LIRLIQLLPSILKLTFRPSKISRRSRTNRHCPNCSTKCPHLPLSKRRSPSLPMNQLKPTPMKPRIHPLVSACSLSPSAAAEWTRSSQQPGCLTTEIAQHEPLQYHGQYAGFLFRCRQIRGGFDSATHVGEKVKPIQSEAHRFPRAPLRCTPV
jgi:hypothetical protein